MFLALFLAVSPSSWVPVRWTSSDPVTLDLLNQTPVNCLLLERAQWSKPFAAAASARKISVLGVVHPGPSALDQARQAAALALSAVVLEGDFPAAIDKALGDSKVPYVELCSRNKMRFDPGQAIAGTNQGIWPGVDTGKGGEA